MQVMDHVPADWFLLRDGSEWYLDINYSSGFASYTRTIRLTPTERAAYAAGGHDYIVALAKSLHECSSEAFAPRSNESKGLEQTITDAIVTWRKENALD